MSKSIHADVIEGRDGYLFLSRGKHGVLALFSGEKGASDASVRIFRDNAARRAAFCADRTITFRTCIFPDKIAALGGHLDTGGTTGSIYQRLYADEVGALPVFYPIEVLQGQTDCFMRTDTHYSGIGCVAVSAALIGQDYPDLVDPFLDQTRTMIGHRPQFCGDLGRKLAPRRQEADVTVISSGPKRGFRTGSNGVRAGNDGLMILQCSLRPLTNRTLLIFGDSFFRQILPLLGTVFRNVVFCRTRYFHDEIVEAIAPDTIYCGQAERYLSRCYCDTERPNFLSYAWSRGKALAPDESFPELWQKLVTESRLLPQTTSSRLLP